MIFMEVRLISRGVRTTDQCPRRCVQPLARTLSVSQGKGRPLLLALVSAAMDAIELWHAENVPLAATHRSTRGDQPRPVLPDDGSSRDVGQAGHRLGSAGLHCRYRIGGKARHARPAKSRELPRVGPADLDVGGVVWSCNGLAAENAAEEAVLHMLYEIVERDALADLPAREFGNDTGGCEPRDVDSADLIGMV
jgi:ribosomal protein S12 methylthiotransferase accessory factor